MKRDMDRIRDLMLLLEELPPNASKLLHLTGGEASLNAAHIGLMSEGGLADAEVLNTFGGEADVLARGLTWKGHDLLDSIRDASVWKETKSTMLDKAGTLSFELIKVVATQIIKQRLGLHA